MGNEIINVTVKPQTTVLKTTIQTVRIITAVRQGIPGASGVTNPKLVYAASNITQTGTNIPTIGTEINDTGFTATYFYEGPGRYYVLFSGDIAASPLDVFPTFTHGYGLFAQARVFVYNSGLASIMRITVADALTGVLTDGILNSGTLLIFVKQ